MRCIVASALLGSLQGGAARAAEPDQEPRLEIQIRRTRLDNGMRVVLSRDISRPTVAICLMYAVGVRDEARGQRGLSLLLERLLSRDSSARRDLSQLEAIGASGGRSGARVAADRTEFRALLPSSALAIGLAATAERNLKPALSSERFEEERAALLDELRSRGAARAHDGGYAALRSLVFTPEMEAISASDAHLGALERVTFEAARRFVERHYTANNAVLAVAGNFEVVEALKLIRRHFGQARRADVPSAALSSLMEQNQPRLVSSPDALTRTPSTYSGWAIPAPETAEHRALELAATILARGDSSRLHQLLVLQEALAREVEAWTDDARDVDLFGLRVVLDEDADPDHVRRLWSAQLGALGRWGPTSAELDRAKHQLGAAFLRSLDGNLARGRRLASFELFRGDAEELMRELPRYMAVSREELQRAVGRYLIPARENRVTLTPGGGARGRESSAASSSARPWLDEVRAHGEP